MRSRLGLLIGLAACNEIYGLEETKVSPPESDRDADGTADSRDVCPDVFDPAQADVDGDGFGDACDLCPGVATAVNHDEDGDARGDACDKCPAFPDFQLDADADGVGDSCDDDNARQNRWLMFDPFVELGPAWTTMVGSWVGATDAIASDRGARLRAAETVLDGTKPYALSIGITVLEPPSGEEDVFGVELVDEGGAVFASCLVGCVAHDCRFHIRPNSNPFEPNPLTVVPVNVLELRRNDFGLACEYANEIATDEDADGPPVAPRLSVQLVGSAKVQFRHVAIRQ